MKPSATLLLLLCFLFVPRLSAQDRVDSFFADWMASPALRQELKITEEQKKKILEMVNHLRASYHRFFEEHPIPSWPRNGPRGELIADALPELQRLRNQLRAEFEYQLMVVLDEDQGNRLLGHLIRASGPRSMVESAELRRRMKLTRDQIRSLEEIYFTPQEIWSEEMHEGDTLQHVFKTLPPDKESLESAHKASTAGMHLRYEIVFERIWKIRAKIDAAQAEMDEQAMRTITPEQKLIYEKLESYGPPAGQPRLKPIPCSEDYLDEDR